MSGTNQHTVPQLLLRGFGRKNKAKAIQVVVYRRDKVFSTGTHGIGAERFFYSGPTEKSRSTLDARITEHEKQLDRFLERLRSAADETDVDAKEASEAIVHFTVRTAQLRNSFAHGAGRVVQGVADAFLDPERRWKLMGFDQPKPTGEIKETIEKAYVEGGFRARGIPRKTFFKFMFDGMKEQFRKESQATKELEGAISTLVRSIPNAIASGHRISLERSLAPERRVEALRQLNWRLQRSSFDLLLPDCVAIEGAEDVRPLAFAPNETLRTVVMPIESRLVLVGQRQGHVWTPPETLNPMLARCSHEYFVAKDRTRDLEKLVPEIGTVTTRFMNANVDEGLKRLDT